MYVDISDFSQSIVGCEFRNENALRQSISAGLGFSSWNWEGEKRRAALKASNTGLRSMEPFVKAMYKLEGDGALSLVAYQELSMLYASLFNQHYPNVVAVVKAEAKGNVTHEQQLINYSKAFPFLN